jgi:hypothetical protein
MSADAAPDDVGLSGVDLIAVLEGRSTVVGPGHLPDAGMALHTLHQSRQNDARTSRVGIERLRALVQLR